MLPASQISTRMRTCSFKLCLSVPPLALLLLQAVRPAVLADFSAPQLAELLHTAVNGLRFAPMDARFYPSLIEAAAQ